MIVPVLTSLALNTMHVSPNPNMGMHGIALSVRKVDNSADNKVVQPALTLAGYPEFTQGNAGFAIARDTTKYDYNVIVVSD